MIRTVSIERLLLGGNALSVASAAGLAATMWLGHIGVASILGWMFLYTCGAGMSSPAALTKAVSVDPLRVGSAAGIYGFAQMVVGAICTALASVGHANPAISAVAVLLCASVLGQLSFWTALAPLGSGGRSVLKTPD